MQLHAHFVSVAEFAGQYFEARFDAEDPSVEFDPSAPLQPYLLIQKQFEDHDGGVCYIETHEPDTYAGHFKLHLLELTSTRLDFEISRSSDRRIEVMYSLTAGKFREVKRVLDVIFAG